MNLLINTLVEWYSADCNNDQPHIERVLCIDTFATEVIVIKLFDKRALPVRRSYDEINQAIAANEIRVLQSDPYASLSRPECDICESHRRRRDKAWELIERLVANTDKDFLLNSAKRGPLITALSRSSGRAKKLIYNYLRRYWQAGGMKNALLPAFNNCGGKGKRRIAQHPNAPKLGRKSALTKATGNQQGIRVTRDVERRFKRGIKKFYETSDKLSLKDAYDLTIEKFFNDGYALMDGIPTPIIPSRETLPTIRQFRYWYETVHRNIKREKTTREGEREYNLQGRELLGDSTQMAFGPGSIYQIDATIGNTYLVSSLDRTRIIGRPVIYGCIDVFSRALTGFSVTLEGPSWLGAMLALDNVAMDKVSFCAEFGISIKSEDWPCHALPEAILADRGEFAGYAASTLVNAFRMRMHNAASGRADWKGIIERYFGTIDEKFIKFLPGHVPQLKRRGGPDYVLKAGLTLNEFRQLFICHVLDYNINHYLKEYRKDEFMIADHVERYPLDIWNWGIKNRSGHLHTFTQDVVRLNLLPRKLVSVTPRGIHFEGELYYTCDMAIREGWFARARARGNRKIEVAFDLRTTDHIYLPLDSGTRLEVCHLTPASIHLQGRDWHEVTDYFALERQAEQAAQTRIQQSRAHLNARREQIVAEATEKTQAALAAAGNPSKCARKRGIRNNRILERERERSQNAWLLDTSNANTKSSNPNNILGQNTTMQDASADQYVAPVSRIAQIRSLRNKEWGNNEEE
jgi:putative transposase